MSSEQEKRQKDKDPHIHAEEAVDPKNLHIHVDEATMPTNIKWE